MSIIKKFTNKKTEEKAVTKKRNVFVVVAKDDGLMMV